MLPALQILWGGVRFFTGAALFSFFEVVAWRLPRGLSPLRGRSVCPACGAVLGPAELVPVASWLALRGRCRHCGVRIPAWYPAGELLGGGAALLAAARFGDGPLLGLGPEAWLALLLGGVLYAIARLDAATREIPDALNAAVALLGLCRVALLGARQGGWVPTVLSHGLGALCVSLPMLVLCLAVPGAFGGGDIKLMAAAGLFLGWQATLAAFFLAVVSGGGYGFFLLAAGRARRGDQIAFGPFLCAGIAAALLAGGWLVRRYLALF